MEDAKDIVTTNEEVPRDAETILFEHNAEKENIQAALEVAKLFIMRKKRILAGGMAIILRELTESKISSCEPLGNCASSSSKSVSPCAK